MSEAVEIVRRVYDAANRRDMDAARPLLDPEFVLDVTANVFNPAVWEGREGVAAWAAQVDEVWEGYRMEIVDAVELEDGRVLVTVDAGGSGRTSGMELRGTIWHIWTLRDGRALRCDHFTEWEKAREAAELPA